MREKYDHYVEPAQGIKYGVLNGLYYSNTVIFVKLPSDTGLYGYNNKYYRFARDLRKRTGATIICSPHYGEETSKQFDLEVLNQYAWSSKPTFRLIGVGDGARYCLSHLYHKKSFDRVLIVNMPISHELGETVELLTKVDKKKVKFIYGDEDPAYRYTPLLRRLYADVVTIKNCDHNFTGRTSTFVGLKDFM